MAEHDKDSTGSSADDRSKDAYYEKIADIANEMIEKHGKDFAMGTLVLAARFIAEGKSLRDSNAVEEATH